MDEHISVYHFFVRNKTNAFPETNLSNIIVNTFDFVCLYFKPKNSNDTVM